MKTFLLICAVLFSLAPARNEFFGAKCKKLKGKCRSSCQKNEELVAFCQKSLKCCLELQTCE
ncbi:beta-defensin 106 [Fukomys damarensis]|uniref:beta-defensin 106 n=1 Tax=Fukomys damarensis TaxID=885580 RepID=UPI00053FD975|nr:beta-defensin 106 [Fukomys damarensis]